MSKIVCIGDIHGRSIWKLIVDRQKDSEIIVFQGDYFDTHEDVSAAIQLYNFQEIINFKKESKKEVILLIGNHDIHYFPEIGYTGTSGYQHGAAASITMAITDNREHLQMAYSHDNVLFTHAGLGQTWFDNNVPELPCQEITAKYLAETVDDVWKYKPLSFNFTGRYDPYGNEAGQTPVWIRPQALMQGSQFFKKEGVIQVVGHTGQKCIDIEGKATGGKYFFIDTLGTSGEYLIIEDGKFSVGNTK